jgi:hypothetical protein
MKFQNCLDKLVIDLNITMPLGHGQYYFWPVGDKKIKTIILFFENVLTVKIWKLLFSQNVYD